MLNAVVSRMKKSVRNHGVGGQIGPSTFFVCFIAGLILTILSFWFGDVASSVRAEPTKAGGHLPVVHIAGPRTGPFSDRTKDIEVGVRAALQDLGGDTFTAGVQVLEDRCGDMIVTPEPKKSATPKAKKTVAKDKANGVSGNEPDVIEPALETGTTFVVIGHPCARTALAAAKTYATRNHLFLAPVTRHPMLTDTPEHTTVVRLTGRDDQQGKFAGAYLARHFSARDVVVVHDRTKFGKALAADITQAWPLLPEQKLAPAGQVDDVPRDRPHVLTLVSSKTSYADLITKIKELMPKALYLAVFPAEAHIVMRELAAVGFTAELFGPDVLAIAPVTGGQTDDPRLAKIKVSLPADLSNMKVAQNLVERLGRENGSVTDAMIRAYLAVEVWWINRARAKSENGSDLLEAISQEPTMTSIGPIAFDTAGDPDLPSYLFYERGRRGYVPASSH